MYQLTLLVSSANSMEETSQLTIFILLQDLGTTYHSYECNHLFLQ